MYSLNVPVPGAVSEIAWDLRSSITGFELLRDELTLVVKRLDARTAGEFAALERAVRSELAGTAPFEVEVQGIDRFEDPPTDPAPVVYLDVHSPAIESLHADLVDRFQALGPVEGAGYTPHITLARGGPSDARAALRDVTEPSHRWTVDRLIFWDARRELPAGEVALPA